LYEKVFNFKLDQGYSAETSGGLFICIDRNDAKKYVDDMHKLGEWAWIIGEVVEGNREVEIMKNSEFIYV